MCGRMHGHDSRSQQPVGRETKTNMTWFSISKTFAKNADLIRIPKAPYNVSIYAYLTFIVHLRCRR